MSPVKDQKEFTLWYLSPRKMSHRRRCVLRFLCCKKISIIKKLFNFFFNKLHIIDTFTLLLIISSIFIFPRKSFQSVKTNLTRSFFNPNCIGGGGKKCQISHHNNTALINKYSCLILPQS